MTLFCNGVNSSLKLSSTASSDIASSARPSFHRIRDTFIHTQQLSLTRTAKIMTKPLMLSAAVIVLVLGAPALVAAGICLLALLPTLTKSASIRAGIAISVTGALLSSAQTATAAYTPYPMCPHFNASSTSTPANLFCAPEPFLYGFSVDIVSTKVIEEGRKTEEGESISALDRQRENHLLPYLKQIRNTILPFQQENLKYIPSYLSRYLHPNYYSIAQGAATLSFQTLYQFQQSHEYSPLPVFSKNLAESYEDSLAKLCVFISKDPTSRNEVLGKLSQSTQEETEYGFPLYLPGLPIESLFTKESKAMLRFGIDPAHFRNHKAALVFIEEKLISPDTFLTLSTQEITDTILYLHQCLIQGNNVQIGEKWRQEPVLIFRPEDKRAYKDPNVKIRLQAMQKMMKKNGATPAEIKLFEKKILPVIKKMHFNPYKTIENFTGRELEVHNKAYPFGTMPEEIPQLMQAFAQSLKFYTKKKYNSLAIAAWAHTELVRIHPFGDANGRLARLIMNTILMQNGYLPVVFDHDLSYTQAVEEDLEKHGSFANFLATRVMQIQHLARERKWWFEDENEFIPDPADRHPLSQREEPCEEMCEIRKEVCKDYIKV